MTKKVREALKRVESEVRLITANTTTVGSRYAQFIEDIYTLLKFVKEWRKRV